MTRFMTMSALLLSTACLEAKTDDTSSEPSNEASGEPSNEASGEPSSDTGTEPEEEPLEAWITWDGDSALLNLENASDDGIYYFGMAETKGAYTSTLDAENAGAWTAEDCTGFSQLGDYCHEVPAAVDGFGYLELIRTDSINNLTTTGDPQYTLFYQTLADDGMTYILDDVINGLCYVWGDMPSYYDDFASCEYMFEWE